MTTARSAIAPPGSNGYYHCVSRCVRRTFLCGFDRSTGQNFNHRRGWIVDRMNELAQIYAVRVLAFSAMSNHMHLALHIDPAWVEAWTDREVAERWNRLFPRADMNEAQQADRIKTWLVQVGKIANMRERLASVSEFMKYLSQPIARRANIEDDCTGKFWEGRFKCQRLLDEAAVLSAMVYVDLNPVRAAMAQDLEESDYTSIQQRIQETARKLGGSGEQLQAVAGVSGTGSLSISIAQYLNLVDWTGRQMHPGKRGKACPRLDRGIDPERPRILDRLGLTDRTWTTQVKATESHYYRAIGAAESLIEYANHIGQKWLQGIGVARELSKTRPKPG
jgi:REP element-mobilizing transposase RayT